MSGLNNLNFRNFITFKGSVKAPEKAEGTKSLTNGASLPPALSQDTFTKTQVETKACEVKEEKAKQFEDDYDEEYELRQQEWLQERLEQLEEAAQNLEGQSLEELYHTLSARLNLEYDAPEAEPSFKTIADVIISKLDTESINSKEAAEILYLAFSSAHQQEEKTQEELAPILPHVAALLHQAGEERYQTNFDTLQAAFKDSGAEFSGRIKTAESIEGKIPNAIIGNIQRGEENIFNAASDICGYRLVVDGTEAQTEKIIETVEKLIEEGTYTPFLISSHGADPYISKEEVLRLHEEKGFHYTIRPYPGFVGTNIILKDKEGKKLELQITGKETNRVNVKEHKFYKLWTMAPEEKAKYFKSRQSLDAYGEYANACYAHARGLELGEIEPSTEKPTLPEGLSEDLRLI